MGRWGMLIESNYWEAKLDVAPAVDGFDAFEPNVEHCRQRGAYRRVWKQTLPSSLAGEWDTVLACEVVEHVPSEQVAQTLDVLEGCARGRVLISTPNGPLYRPGHETSLGYNPWEAHVSFPSRELLEERGYRVFGAGFGRYNSRLALLAKRWGIRGSLTSLPHRLPAIAETLVAVKDVGR